MKPVIRQSAILNRFVSQFSASNELTPFQRSDSFGTESFTRTQVLVHIPNPIMIKVSDHAHAIYVGADDELSEQVRASVESIHGWELQRVVDVDTALTIWSEQHTSAVILYIGDEYSYAQSLKLMRAANCDAMAVIVIYDRLEPEQILDLYRSGAAECLGRPANLSRLLLVLDMFRRPAKPLAVSNEESGRENTKTGEDSNEFHSRMMDQVRSVASLTTTLLITGETGTGKTRLSRLIHGLSDRKNKPFLALNCGALSESLIDTELFGHVKGAFTGADRNYTGKLAQCRDGTLLLDEIDTLSPIAQVKLLQVVEERVFQPVGSSRFEPLQARLIVASNKSLQHEVDQGRFRSDLFYRLNVMAFELAPLRERRREIAELANRFTAEFANQHGFNVASISPAAMMHLESNNWPGNIRELRNVVERAVILSAGTTIEPSHLPSHMVSQVSELQVEPADDGASYRSRNKLANARLEAEREQLRDSLQRNGNNRSKTAHELGISRVTLYKRLRKLQML